ncbi:hypothetical protein EON65_34535 [archaeon]|nr:MAG: hypothetical protein EON65_34535 [archaeon]
MDDFNIIDKDSDGSKCLLNIPQYCHHLTNLYFVPSAITYKEFQRWIKEKALADNKGPWNMLLHHPDVVRIAHSQAGKYAKTIDTLPAQKIVDSHDFKRLLVQLFAISMLWVHFKNADEWVDGHDFGNMTLSRSEFQLACRTITGAYANEALSDEQVDADFTSLDKNGNGAIDFIEVCVLVHIWTCTYMCRYSVCANRTKKYTPQHNHNVLIWFAR